MKFFTSQNRALFLVCMYAVLTLFVNVTHFHAPIEKEATASIYQDNSGHCQICHFNHAQLLDTPTKTDVFLPFFDVLTEGGTLHIGLESIQLFSDRAPPVLG